MARSRSGTRGTAGAQEAAQVDRGPGERRPASPTRRRVGRSRSRDSITVKELAELIGINSADVIRELIRSGIFATINQTIDRDTAALVTEELGFEVAEARPAEARGEVEGEAAAAPATKVALFEEDDPSQLVERAPIVTVMGHVDHGKTSLLDRIRETAVAAGERGGITQRIGASEAIHDGRRIVFLDTPGHEAFTSMRARGARVTDIAVLVVAADDGVMPQTVEAIDHARAAGVPIIVALNKIDLMDSKPERIKTELSERGVIIEEYGGDVPLVAVSAKTGQGIDDLLETILLTSDANVEPKANPDRPAVGTVVEAELDRARGPVASILVQTGTLRVGDVVVVGNTYGRARALEDSTGKRIRKSGPATAVVLLGLAGVPEAGDVLRVVESEKIARAHGRGAPMPPWPASGGHRPRHAGGPLPPGPGRPDQGAAHRPQVGRAGLPRRGRPRARADPDRRGPLQLPAPGHRRHHRQRRQLLAAASDAVVVGFNVQRRPRRARRAAEAEGVEIRLYDIIYKLTEDMEAALAGMLEPEVVESVQGRAEVRQVFRVGRSQAIAGSYVTDGRIVRGGGARLSRRPAHRHRPHRVAASLQGRRARGGHRLRVRHRPGRLPRSRSSTSSSRFTPADRRPRRRASRPRT